MMKKLTIRKTIKQVSAAAALSTFVAWSAMAQEWGSSFEDETVGADTGTQNPGAAETATPATSEFHDSVGQSGAYTLERDISISSELLASSAFLWTEKDSKGYVLPGNGIVDKSDGKAAYQLYEKISVRPVGNADYKLGDTVDILKQIKLVSFKGKTANLVKRTGMAVVEGHSGKRLIVSVVQMWDLIKGGERIAPTVSFDPIYLDSLVVPENNLQASVVMRVEKTVAPYLHQSFIIDKGSDDGVKLGDHFEVFEKQKDDSLSEELLVGLVSNVTPKASTLVILKLYKGRLKKGDSAFLTHRVYQR